MWVRVPSPTGLYIWEAMNWLVEQLDQPSILKVVAFIEEMRDQEEIDLKAALPKGLHEIGYRKGKFQAFNEVLELIVTGKKPM